MSKIIEDDIYNQDPYSPKQKDAVVPGVGADGSNGSNGSNGINGKTNNASNSASSASGSGIGSGMSSGSGSATGSGVSSEADGSDKGKVPQEGEYDRGEATLQQKQKQYEGFTGSTETDVINWLEKQMAGMPKPLTEDEIKDQQRRKRAEGVVSGISDAIRSLANLYFTSKGAPNMYDPANSMAAKHKARWDKLKAEQEESDQKYLQMAMMRNKLIGEIAEREYRKQKDEQAQANFDRQQTEVEKDNDFRRDMQTKTFDETVKNNEHNRNMAEKTFNEGVRQHNDNMSIHRSQLSLQSQQLKLGSMANYMTVNLGTGYGAVQIPINNINEPQIARVFSLLPEDIRKQIHGKKKISAHGVTEEPITTEQMWRAIGDFVEDRDGDGDAIRAQRAAVRQAIVGMTEDKPKTPKKKTIGGF